MDSNCKNKKDNLYYLEEYFDLTISQVFTLIMLSSFPQGIIRYTFLQSVNAFVSPDNKISPSSFYNSIAKLEKKGLIEFIQDEQGKIALVKTTTKGHEALHNIGHITVLSGTDIPSIFSNIVEKIISHLNLTKPFESVLVISKDITLDLHLYSLIEQNANQIHCLASDDDFKRYIAPYSTSIHQTKVMNKMIREPDNIFEVTFLPTYFPTKNFHGLNDNQLWTEIVRVTKPRGQIILIAFKKMKYTDNFLLDGLIDLFNCSPLVGFITEDELRECMIKAEIDNIEITEFSGIFLGVGKVRY